MLGCLSMNACMACKHGCMHACMYVDECMSMLMFLCFCVRTCVGNVM